jgi:hypothetical protein
MPAIDHPQPAHLLAQAEAANDAPFRGFFALVALCAPRPVGI